MLMNMDHTLCARAGDHPPLCMYAIRKTRPRSATDSVLLVAIVKCLLSCNVDGC